MITLLFLFGLQIWVALPLGVALNLWIIWRLR